MQQELKPVVKKASLRPVRFGDEVVFAGPVGGVKVIATQTSMGTAAARSTTQRVLSGMVVDHLIVAGIAGSLHPAAPLGHVLVPEVVVDGYTKTGYRQTALAAHVPRGVLSTSDELDNTEEDIARLVGEGVHAVDMETASIAAVCEEHHVPWSAFRAISDQNDDVIDEEMFHLANIDGSPNVPAIAKFVVTRPWLLPSMARLGKQMTTATNAAADAALAACRDHDFEVRSSRG